MNYIKNLTLKETFLISALLGAVTIKDLIKVINISRNKVLSLRILNEVIELKVNKFKDT